jgi:hypothetical protein
VVLEKVDLEGKKKKHLSGALEPILRQLQRQRCSRLGRFSK